MARHAPRSARRAVGLSLHQLVLAIAHAKRRPDHPLDAWPETRILADAVHGFVKTMEAERTESPKKFYAERGGELTALRDEVKDVVARLERLA